MTDFRVGDEIFRGFTGIEPLAVQCPFPADLFFRDDLPVDAAGRPINLLDRELFNDPRTVQLIRALDGPGMKAVRPGYQEIRCHDEWEIPFPWMLYVQPAGDFRGFGKTERELLPDIQHIGIGVKDVEVVFLLS